MAAQITCDDGSNDDKMEVVSAANKVLQIYDLVETILLEVICIDQKDLFTKDLTNILIKYRSLNRTFNHVLKTSHYIQVFSGLDVCSFDEARNKWRCLENGYIVERYVTGYPLRLPRNFKERPGATYEGDGDDGELFLYWNISTEELNSFDTDDCGSWRGFWFGTQKTRDVWLFVKGKRKYEERCTALKERILVDRPIALGDLVDRGRERVAGLDSGTEWGVQFYQMVDPEGNSINWR